jgi:hypothetical protein
LQFNLGIVPQGILKVFPRVEGLHLRNCPITTLIGNELDEHANLTSFFISGSQLTNGRIPENLFTNTPNLKLVDLSRNAITRVGDGLMDHLTDLENVWFVHNICLSDAGRNATEIALMIENLRTQCPDVEPTTTTTTESSSMLKGPFLILVILLLFVVGKM